MVVMETKKGPLISVIVPIYKAESYLHRCVDSLLAQTFTDFELLLIDDGSPDKSGELCDEYARKDNRIRVFHKENGGVSSARQKGMDEACGEYIIHADPDDWVEPNMLEELYREAIEKNADMVICDYILENRGGSVICKQNPKECTAKGILLQMMHHQLHGSCWNKFIRRACYDKYNVRFPKGMDLWEDLYVICSLLHYPIKCSYLPKAFYHYDVVSNKNSILKNLDKESLNSRIRFVEHFKNLGYSTSWLYPSMRMTKEQLYVQGLFPSKQAVSLYSEINEAYISVERDSHDFVFQGLSALIRGKRLQSCFYKFRYYLKVFNDRLKSVLFS